MSSVDDTCLCGYHIYIYIYICVCVCVCVCVRPIKILILKIKKKKKKKHMDQARVLFLRENLGPVDWRIKESFSHLSWV